jgi:hypothetical protein
LLVVAFAVEESPARLGHDSVTSRALPALPAFAREAKLAQIVGIDAAVIWTFRIPAEGIWGSQLFFVFFLFPLGHRAGDCQSTHSWETTRLLGAQ